MAVAPRVLPPPATLHRSRSVPLALHPDEIPDPTRAASWQDEAKQHPLLANALGNLSIADFVPGVDGPVRDLPEKQVGAVRAAYFGLLSEIDHQLDRVFSYLDGTAYPSSYRSLCR